jgi:glutaredoxin-related protein
LSTILLGASNYCMQCMSAPTRAEAEQAHAKFRWVDIGTPSIRNLGKIRGLRVVLWLLLGISSLPLHLL